MCQQEKHRLLKQIKSFFCFKFKEQSECINKYLPFERNILIELTCRAAMFCPAGNGVLGCQSRSPVPDTLFLSSKFPSTSLTLVNIYFRVSLRNLRYE